MNAESSRKRIIKQNSTDYKFPTWKSDLENPHMNPNHLGFWRIKSLSRVGKGLEHIHMNEENRGTH